MLRLFPSHWSHSPHSYSSPQANAPLEEMTADVSTDTTITTDAAETYFEEQPTAETTAESAPLKETTSPMEEAPKEEVPKEEPFLGSRVTKYSVVILYWCTAKSIE